MARVNQAGDPVQSELIYVYGIVFASLTPSEKDQVLALLCKHIGLKVVRTNATKHGNTELELQKEED